LNFVKTIFDLERGRKAREERVAVGDIERHR
jgi:hypothetical protein